MPKFAFRQQTLAPYWHRNTHTHLYVCGLLLSPPALTFTPSPEFVHNYLPRNQSAEGEELKKQAKGNFPAENLNKTYLCLQALTSGNHINS